MSILKIRDENGNWVCVPAMKGEKGEPGGVDGHASQHAIWGDDPISPSDIGAASEMHAHSPEEIGASPAGHSHTAEELGVAKEGHSHTAEELGVATADHRHDDVYYSKEETDALVSAGDVTWKCLADVSVADGENGVIIALSDDLRNYSEAQVIIYPGDDFSGSCFAHIYTGSSSNGAYLGGRALYGDVRYTSIIVPSIYEIDSGSYLFAINDDGRWTTGSNSTNGETIRFNSGGTFVTSSVTSLCVYLQDSRTFEGTGGRVIVIAR